MVSDRRSDVSIRKPHYWLERAGMYKVRYGCWIYVGHNCANCKANYLYWSMQSNEKPS